MGTHIMINLQLHVSLYLLLIARLSNAFGGHPRERLAGCVGLDTVVANGCADLFEIYRFR